MAVLADAHVVVAEHTHITDKGAGGGGGGAVGTNGVVQQTCIESEIEGFVCIEYVGGFARRPPWRVRMVASLRRLVPSVRRRRLEEEEVVVVADGAVLTPPLTNADWVEERERGWSEGRRVLCT